MTLRAFTKSFFFHQILAKQFKKKKTKKKVSVTFCLRVLNPLKMRFSSKVLRSCGCSKEVWEKWEFEEWEDAQLKKKIHKAHGHYKEKKNVTWTLLGLEVRQTSKTKKKHKFDFVLMLLKKCKCIPPNPKTMIVLKLVKNKCDMFFFKIKTMWTKTIEANKKKLYLGSVSESPVNGGDLFTFFLDALRRFHFGETCWLGPWVRLCWWGLVYSSSAFK